MSEQVPTPEPAVVNPAVAPAPSPMRRFLSGGVGRNLGLVIALLA